MRTYYIILLLAAVAVLCGAVFVFYEKPKECEESEEDMPYIEHPYAIVSQSGISMGPAPTLWAHGDYTKMKLIVRLHKKDYEPGETIGVMIFARNDSNRIIHVQRGIDIEFCKLFRFNGEEIAMIPVWHRSNPQYKESEVFGEYDRTVRNKYGSGVHIKLKPGEELRISCGTPFSELNTYFDLSQPDTYELTCFLATACFGQYYEPPLQSNTLTFRILEDGEKAENAEEGMNPPKGEEVFKQPKPPKSVFYVYDDDEPGYPWIRTSDGKSIAKPRKIIDVSPETYYRQMAKEQEIRATQIPGQKFDSPLESNEAEFEITSGSRLTPSDLVDSGGF